MRDANLANHTDIVVRSFAGGGDPRMTFVIEALVRHLHAFARETKLTHDEWRAGLSFLTRAGAITDEGRNEFSLLSDVLGFSSLVDFVDSTPGATEGSNLGPFHEANSPERPNGVDLSPGNEGTPVLLTGTVRGLDGKPIAGAEIDFWQAAISGLYPKQDAAQAPDNLKCRIRTDAEGRYRLITVRPGPYTVPYDGPVGDLLRATGRDCWRPSHFHMIVSAPGHAPVVTEIFDAESPHLDDDAVFGVRKSLIAEFVKVTDPAKAASLGLKPPFHLVSFDFTLAKK
jgi:protocatechuate 3,4-dioxygenase beta subunit